MRPKRVTEVADKKRTPPKKKGKKLKKQKAPAPEDSERIDEGGHIQCPRHNLWGNVQVQETCPKRREPFPS